MKRKVLAIGNSFSDNALRFLPQIVASVKGCELVHAHAYIGGCPMEKHLRLARLHEAEPSNPEGVPYEGGKASLKDLLLREKWDLITIQQFSGDSFKPETYRPYAKELVDCIRKYRPESEIGVHETWAYRFDNAATFRDGFTAEEMYRRLAKAYYGIAKELGFKRVIPSGDAFQLVLEIPGERFEKDPSFDPEKAVFPQLPDQSKSLHVGWFWNNERKLCYDHGHANKRGEYLAGCVWFENIFGVDARKVSFVPPELEAKDAEFLREMARKAAGENVKPALWPL